MESTGLSRLLRSFRRLLRQEFGTLRSRLPTLWTNSYFVATVGGSTLDDVKGYVQNQRNVSATPLPSQG
jgi:putative transposase